MDYRSNYVLIGNTVQNCETMECTIMRDFVIGGGGIPMRECRPSRIFQRTASHGRIITLVIISYRDNVPEINGRGIFLWVDRFRMDYDSLLCVSDEPAVQTMVHPIRSESSLAISCGEK